jgi:hypothetical protein
MVCACGRTIARQPAFVDAVTSATSYDTCVYRGSCGRGYSNAAEAAKRTCITDTPERNLAPEVAAGLDEAFGAALNVRNRTAKRDTSSDPGARSLVALPTEDDTPGRERGRQALIAMS